MLWCGHHQAMAPIVIVAPEDSYRTAAFLQAAATLRAQIVIAGTVDHPLTGTAPELRHLALDLADPQGAAATIAAAVPDAAAVLGIDDAGVLAANAAATRLGLRHNPAGAVAATRDKLLLRESLAGHRLAQPGFAAAGVGEVAGVASEIGYPVVLKPTGLSAGRGVIRADGEGAARAAEERIRRILLEDCGDESQHLLVEEYIAGPELAVEGLLGPSGLDVLALIDKPEPSSGPHFAETFLITPSRLPQEQQESATQLIKRA
jgi:biotin carboxylase